MNRAVLDAVEGGIARLVDEDGNEQEVAAALLPPDACEGDCLVYDETNGWQTDAAETAARRQRLREKRLRLLNRR